MDSTIDHDPALKAAVDLTQQELTELLLGRYGPTEIPPCRVCGCLLGLQMGGGGTPHVWACDGHDWNEETGLLVGWLPGRKPADQHYIDSKFVDHRRGGDSRVVELVRRYEQLKAEHATTSTTKE